MVWTNFLLILKGFLVLCSLLYNKLENMFLFTPSHVPVSRFALRSYVLARTRITKYEINWDHKLAPTTSSFFLGGAAVYLIFYYFIMPRHFSLRKLFEKEKTIIFLFLIFSFLAKLKTPNIKLIFHYLPQFVEKSCDVLFTGWILWS